MRSTQVFSATLILLLFSLLATPVLAYDQPSINLGFTSFLDGGPPAGPGLYFTEYLQYYTADTLEDLPFANPEIEALVSLNQIIYQSDQELLLGGKWGLDVIVPLVKLDSNVPQVPDNGSGLGDVLVGPYLQWDPVMGDKGPLFIQRVELQFILPTGKYSASKALNPGSNFFSFNPYWSGTLFLGPKVTVSTRLHYLWNAKNNDPNSPTATNDSQAGQAFHGNFAANYEVIPKMLRLGINGYFFKQITSSKEDGNKIPAKEKVFAIGPGALLSFSADTHLFFNAYFEQNVEYRPKGERYLMRLVHHF